MIVMMSHDDGGDQDDGDHEAQRANLKLGPRGSPKLVVLFF